MTTTETAVPQTQVALSGKVIAGHSRSSRFGNRNAQSPRLGIQPSTRILGTRWKHDLTECFGRPQKTQQPPFFPGPFIHWFTHLWGFTSVGGGFSELGSLLGVRGCGCVCFSSCGLCGFIKRRIVLDEWFSQCLSVGFCALDRRCRDIRRYKFFLNSLCKEFVVLEWYSSDLGFNFVPFWGRLRVIRVHFDSKVAVLGHSISRDNCRSREKRVWKERERIRRRRRRKRKEVKRWDYSHTQLKEWGQIGSLQTDGDRSSEVFRSWNSQATSSQTPLFILIPNLVVSPPVIFYPSFSSPSFHILPLALVSSRQRDLISAWNI